MGLFKPKRKRVVTTLRDDLWHALQIEAAVLNLDANDILEELIAGFLPPGAVSKKFPVKKVVRKSAIAIIDRTRADYLKTAKKGGD